MVAKGCFILNICAFSSRNFQRCNCHCASQFIPRFESVWKRISITNHWNSIVNSYYWYPPSTIAASASSTLIFSECIWSPSINPSFALEVVNDNDSIALVFPLINIALPILGNHNIMMKIPSLVFVVVNQLMRWSSGACHQQVGQCIGGI